MPTASKRGRQFPRSVGVMGRSERTRGLLTHLLPRLPNGTHLTSLIPPGEPTPRVHPAASPADLAARSEAIFMLPAEVDEIDRLLEGPSGLQAGIHSPTTVIIGSLMGPDQVPGLADRLAARTTGLVQLIDAPLLDDWATGPRLPILVGGSTTAYAETEPLLAILGGSRRIGELGAAQLARAGECYVHGATLLAEQEWGAILDRRALRRREDDRLPAGPDPAPFQQHLPAALAIVGHRARQRAGAYPLLAQVAQLIDAQLHTQQVPSTLTAARDSDSADDRLRQ